MVLALRLIHQNGSVPHAGPRSTGSPSRPRPRALPDAEAFRLLFTVAPHPYLVLTPDLVIIDANKAYLEATMTERAAIVGRPVFEVFPDDPADAQADGVRNLRASLQRVLASGEADEMPPQRYPVRRPDGRFEHRVWKPRNLPIQDASGRLVFLLHHVEDLTEQSGPRPGAGDGWLPLAEARLREIIEDRSRLIARTQLLLTRLRGR